jgi:hypothetical protein
MKRNRPRVDRPRVDQPRVDQPRVNKQGENREAGALTLGYVIVFPAFLITVMTVAQIAFWYLADQTALAAARQGVDAARELNAPAGAGQQAALAFARQAGSGYLSSVSASPVNSTPQTIQITVQGHAPSIVPGFIIHVSEVAQGPVERFTTP